MVVVVVAIAGVVVVGGAFGHGKLFEFLMVVMQLLLSLVMLMLLLQLLAVVVDAVSCCNCCWRP